MFSLIYKGDILVPILIYISRCFLLIYNDIRYKTIGMPSFIYKEIIYIQKTSISLVDQYFRERVAVGKIPDLESASSKVKSKLYDPRHQVFLSLFP